MARNTAQVRRVPRSNASLQTAHIVLLTAVTATVLAGYGVCAVMLLTTYRADASSFAGDQGASTSSRLSWGALKGNRRLLMSVTRPQQLLKQQHAHEQAAAQHAQQQWAEFWTSDIPKGTDGPLPCRQGHAQLPVHVNPLVLMRLNRQCSYPCCNHNAQSGGYSSLVQLQI